MDSERTGKTKQVIESALLSAGKRAALASELGISEGQLSKMLNGNINQWCKIMSALDLEVHPSSYVSSIERILKEKL